MSLRRTALGWTVATVVLTGGAPALARTAAEPLASGVPSDAGRACCPAWAASTAPSTEPGQAISVADDTAREGSILRFEVSVPQPAATAVRVTATTSTGTAGEGDFTATTEQIEIPAGLTNAGFVVNTADDLLDEPAETLTVTLSNPQGGTIGDGTATGTIVDMSLVRVVAPAPVQEGGTLRFPVRLDHAAASDVTVALATEDATAVAPGDYTAQTGTDVTIPAGETEAFFDVVTREDQLQESAETVTASIFGVDGPAHLAALSAGGTIQDKPVATVNVIDAPEAAEGQPLQFPVRLSGARQSDVTVTLSTQDGTAVAGSDYPPTAATVTIPAGETERTFTVPTTDDGFDEPDETVTARITGATNASPNVITASGTIRDNDEPIPSVTLSPAPPAVEGQPLRFPLKLSATRISAVTVTLTTQDGSAQAGPDYSATAATVTIPAGQLDGTFTVPTTDDGFDEPDETVTARITGATNASPTLLSAVGTILDNDEPLPVVRLDPPTAVEEGSALRFPLRLDKAAPGPIDIRLSTVDGTAKAPDDYTAQALTLVRIPAGATEAFLEVPTATDELTEIDETVRADIKSGTNASLSVFSATGTIRDGAAVRMIPGRVLGGRVLSGEVRVRPPRGGFVDLGAAAGLRVGTVVDATDGVVELIIPTGPRPVALPAQARVRRARLSGGVFTIRQPRRSAVVTLELTGSSLRSCKRRPKSARRLLADTNGTVRVKGRFAESTSRNGRWLTEDRCASTRVAVTRGRVAMRDTVRGRTATLSKGRARTVRGG